MSMKAILLIAVMLPVFVSNAGATQEGETNVIVVLTDQGYGDLSCRGNPVLKTPNIDKL
jgi:hypothetical protein